MVSAKEQAEIIALENELLPIAGNTVADLNTKAQFLELVRKHKLRKSELVAKYGVELITSKNGRSILGVELWTVYEQVAIAALDCYDLKTAKECILKLLKKFPGSMRACRLEAMYLETSERWQEAEKVYSNLLEDHPTEPSLHKRKIAILKGQGNLPAVVSALNKYLGQFMADFEAWRELGDTYIKLQSFKQAAFCYEEVLLSSPINPLINLTYAEILYTIGGVENLKTAKRYFSSAIEFSAGKNLKALFGLVLCSSALVQALKGSRAALRDERENSELLGLTVKTIESEYAEKSSTKANIISGYLAKIQV